MCVTRFAPSAGDTADQVATLYRHALNSIGLRRGTAVPTLGFWALCYFRCLTWPPNCAEKTGPILWQCAAMQKRGLSEVYRVIEMAYVIYLVI